MVILSVTSKRCRDIISWLYRRIPEDRRDEETERYVRVYRGIRNAIPDAPRGVVLGIAVKLENKRLGKEAWRLVQGMYNVPASYMAREEMRIISHLFRKGDLIWRQA